MSRGRKIKILLWSPSGAGLHYTGSGMNAYRLYHELIRANVDVTLVHGNPLQADLSSVFSANICLGDLRKATVVSVGSFLIKAKFWLLKNWKQFDLFHGIDVFEPTMRPAYWAVKSGLPTVIKPALHHAGFVPSGRKVSDFFGLAKRRVHLAKSVSFFVAISKLIEDELLDIGVDSSRIARIPNGVDTEAFRPSSVVNIPENRLADCKGIRILFVGGLRRRKRIDWLLRILSHPDCSEACIVLVGPECEADHIKYLKQLAVELGVSSRIHIFDHTPDVRAFYRQSDLFVLPSESEGMSNALLEAMSCGLPVVSMAVSGSTDIIRNGNDGFLASDYEELQEAVLKLCRSESLRSQMGISARNRVGSKFSLNFVSNEYLKLFQKLIS